MGKGLGPLSLMISEDWLANAWRTGPLDVSGVRFQDAGQGPDFGLTPPLGGCPKQRETIILIPLVLLRCTVCAVSIDVELGLTLVSPLAPPRRSPTRAASRFHRVWPLAGLGFAVIVNMAWISFLGFEFVKLMKLAFS